MYHGVVDKLIMIVGLYLLRRFLKVKANIFAYEEEPFDNLVKRSNRKERKIYF